MPVVVTPAWRRLRLALIALPIVLISLFGFVREPELVYDKSCLISGDGVVVCAASDMARITRSGTSRLEHPRFDLSSLVSPDSAKAGMADPSSMEQPAPLHWQVARNETIAFELILRRKDRHASDELRVDWSETPIHTSVFQAHYLKVNNAGYNWGPATKVLPYPAAYPDALVPATHECGDTHTQLFDHINLPPPGRNQSVWIEMYIPDDISTGEQVQRIQLTGKGEPLTLDITLEVIDANLPHTPSLEAVGEIYRSYRLEGAGEDRSQASWQRMAQCYQTLAHQHRMVFIERTPDAPQTEKEWQDYATAFGPALTGELFSKATGYTGTGTDTPVTVWRTPWPQSYDIAVQESLTNDQLSEYSELASNWTTQVANNGWHQTRYFAYVFDEVDGPSELAESNPQRQAYISRVHQDMQQVQAAIDEGVKRAKTRTNGNDSESAIDLIWTSHSDPAVWLDNEATTLVDRVRFWAPNGHAANTDFLAQRMEAGEPTWFYHSGHPAVGGHSINLPGSELRSWGVIGARYGIHGQLMWSVNLGADELPFAQPSYKPDDDRVGNGVLVYPGFQLSRIGYPAAAGPIPSMRLKAWHRGLQDAELYFLARSRYPQEADNLIKQLIPRALGEAVAHGDTQPTWPHDAASWISWRDGLMELLSRE